MNDRPDDKQHWFVKTAALGVIPLMAAVFSLIIRSVIGPFWFGTNFDPAYLYLFNSLYIVDGITPIFVDHPGMPLQYLGALIIRLFHVNEPSARIVDHVISHPEIYLNAIWAAMLVLFVVSLFLLGWYAFRKSGDLLFGVLVQSPALIYLTVRSYSEKTPVLPVIVNVNSETLLLTVLNLYVMGLLKLYFDRAKKRNDRQTAPALGLIAALGMTTKITFFPLIVPPLILLSKVREKLIYSVSAALAWLVIMLPVAIRFRKMGEWIYNLAARKGFHGSGDPGVIDGARYVSALLEFAFKDFPFLTLMVAGGLLAGFYSRKKSRTTEEPLSAFLFVLSVCGILQFFLVAKQPSPQYMTPALGLTGILLAFMYRSWKGSERLSPSAVAVLLVLFILVRGAMAFHYQDRLGKISRGTLKFSQEVFSKYKDCVICGQYRASSLPTALHFGDDCLNFNAFTKQLQEKYPHSLYWDRWELSPYHFGTKVDLKSLLQSAKCLLVYGTPYDFENSFVQAEELEKGPVERVYRITGTTGEEAAEHYLLSKILFSKKDYPGAYGHALKAKSLGFPRLEPYIDELETILKENVPTGSQ